MDRRSKIVIGIFVLAVLGIIITEIVRPKPLNWRPSYTSTDKIPFGCYVLYNELPSLFVNDTIKTIDKSVYDVLVETDTTLSSNYLFVNEFVDLDKQETNQLLDYVDRGNTVFISATGFGWELMDTLNINIASDYNLMEGTAVLSLTHKKFKQEEFKLSRGIFNSHFTSVDSTNTTILGHITYTKENYLEGQPNERVSRPNMIKTKFGKGSFIINTTPQAYSNYYMLTGNQDYVSHSFSYLPDEDLLYWDDYKKAGRVIIDSPMRFVLTQVSLKWAYYLTVIGILLFVFFRGKREQRIIPIIEPLKNSSVEFAQAVGSLYHQNKDYTDLVNKKLNYFMAYLRNRYYIDTSSLNEKTVQLLASKAGKSIKETKELIELILGLKNKKIHSEQDSIELNKKITAFKQ
ncbi:DUF4350 domain-containing protein [Flagellimonas nanhaiensis]|uniref:DUF4350 domain-containing protein n=1 Tax=Flagellimonas nanhaiensis TaxID=2292706 RepID=A0A371JMD3_9FLAO|nr:DUF4350 domain-containing protein [Allomuricauda nanhaiensis]RDY58304.1 DUF4350 domain-containing protein [Allomuricauda nanhaiensis]